MKTDPIEIQIFWPSLSTQSTPQNSTSNEDDVEIGNLLVKSFVETYSRKMPGVIVSESRKKELRDLASRRKTCITLIARNLMTREILGTVTLYPPGHPDSRSWEAETTDLRLMAVTQKVQGKGVSTLLLKECENCVLKIKSKAICLHVRKGAKGVAHFYQNNAYKRTPQGDVEQPEISLKAYRKFIK